MSEQNLLRKWYDREYPFDMATCGNCLSMHASDHEGGQMCGDERHRAMIKAVVEAWIDVPDGNDDLERKLPKFLALRKRFARFYPKEAK